MTNLKRGLDRILRNWGHDVLLQRETDGQFSNRLEKHTVRRRLTSSPPTVQHEMPEGIIHTVDVIFYFRPDAKPREGDRVYDLEDNMGQTTFLVDFAEPMRGRGGVVVYYVVGATRETPN